MMIKFLRIVISILLLFMIYVVVATSLKSNLFKEWNFLSTIPWMRATLWDFYANILIIYFWILYKEKGFSSKIIWAFLLFFLGSIGSLLYLLIQLFRIKSSDPVEKLLIRN